MHLLHLSAKNKSELIYESIKNEKVLPLKLLRLTTITKRQELKQCTSRNERDLYPLTTCYVELKDYLSPRLTI